MQIHIDTSQPLTDFDKFVLREILGATGEAPPEPEKKAPGTRTRKKAESAPETPPEPAETPVLDEDLLEQAIARATQLIRVEKKGAQVKAVLDEIGVEKVTKIDSTEKVQAFLVGLDKAGL